MIKEIRDIDFITGNFDYIDQNGNIIGQSMRSSPSGIKLLKKAGKRNTTIMDSEDIHGFVEHQYGDLRTLSVPRKTFMNLGGFHESYSICEDVHFLIRLCAASKRIGVVCKPLAVYFVHQEGLIRSDVVGAQRKSVAALLDLKKHISKKHEKLVFKGLQSAIRRARMDLAYVLIKKNQKGKAISAAFPILFDIPSCRSLKSFISVVLA